jgi:uncharacterized membrane protein YfhO
MATISHYGSQQVEIQTETETPSVLMLNDANYPGWRAYVNEKPTPVLKADHLFRGVVLPPGKNTVKFRYEPLSFRIGTLISAAALCVLLVPLFWRRERNKKHHQRIA